MTKQSRSYKKIVAGTFSAAVAASAVVPIAAHAATPTSTFSDVPSAYNNSVNWAVGQTIIKGYEGGTFKPFNTIDRAHAAVILVNALGYSVPEKVTANPFNDVSADAPYANYIEVAKEHHIFNGDSNGNFHPNQELTRQQMATVLVNAYGLKDNGENAKVADMNHVAPTHQQNVQILANLGITKLQNGNFNPLNQNTRINLVSFLWNVHNYLQNQQQIQQNPPTIQSVSALNGKQIKVTFDKAVDQTTAEDVTNYKLYSQSTSNMVSLVNGSVSNGQVQANATLQEDGKSVVITLLDTNSESGFINSLNTLNTGDYLLYVSHVKDSKDQVIAADSNMKFTGSTANDATAPVLNSASFVNGDGQVHLQFNEPIHLAAPADDLVYFTNGVDKVFLKASADYTGMGSSYSSTADFTVSTDTLSKINALGGNLQFVVSKGAFKDTSSNDVAETTVAPSEQTIPVLQSVSYDEVTNKAIFNFSKTINVSAITSFANKFSIAGVDIDGDNHVKLDTNADQSNSLVFTLSPAQAQKVEAAVRANAEGKVTATVDPKTVEDTDATPNKNEAASSSVDLVVGSGYTEDKTAPILSSATYEKDTSLLKLNFDEAVSNNVSSINGSDIAIYTDDNGVPGIQTTAQNGVAADTKVTDLKDLTQGELLKADGSATSSTDEQSTLYVDTAALANNSDINTAIASGKDLYIVVKKESIQDPSGNAVASDRTMKLNTVTVSNVSAVDTIKTTVTNHTVNSVTVNFYDVNGKAVSMNPATVTNKSNWSVNLTANKLNKPAIDKIIMGDNDTSATIIFKDSLLPTTSYTVTTSGLETNGGNAGDLTGKTFTSATADAVKLASQTPVTTDVNNDGKLDAGDTIEIPFSEEVNIPSDVSMSDFTLNNNHSFGNSAVSLSNDYKTLTITLGSSANVAVGDTITLPTGLEDLEGQKLGADTQTVLPPSTDAAPKMISSVYSDTNGDGKVDEGDSLVVTFDRNIQSAPNAVLTGDFSLNGKMDGIKAVALDGSKATLTLSSKADSSYLAGNTTMASSNVDIESLWGTPSTDHQGVAVSYADTTSPQVTDVKYNRTTHVMTYVFSEPVHFSGTASNSTAVSDDTATMLYDEIASVSTGSSKGTNATNASVSADGKEISFTLDGTESIDQYTTVTLNGGNLSEAVNGDTVSVTDASGNKAQRSQGTAYIVKITN